MPSQRFLALAAALALPLCLAGCPGFTIELPDGSIFIPGFGTVVVEVFNDTDFDVDPRIRFDDDTNFLAGWFPSEELATGRLQPGEVLRYTIDCDELGLILSDEARQYFLGLELAEAESSRTLTRDDDFDCGDTIRFHFIGRDESFGVIVSVNGVVVD